MEEFADIKSRRIQKLLNWLEKHRAIEIKRIGKRTKVSRIYTDKSYPLRLSHSVLK